MIFYLFLLLSKKKAGVIEDLSTKSVWRKFNKFLKNWVFRGRKLLGDNPASIGCISCSIGKV